MGIRRGAWHRAKNRLTLLVDCEDPPRKRRLDNTAAASVGAGGLAPRLVVLVLGCEQGVAGGELASGLRVAVGNDFRVDDSLDGENQCLAADGDRSEVDALIFLVHDLGVFELGLGDQADHNAGIGIDEDLAVIRDGGWWWSADCRAPAGRRLATVKSS